MVRVRKALAPNAHPVLQVAENVRANLSLTAKAALQVFYLL